jgi:hypothetical protein
MWFVYMSMGACIGVIALGLVIKQGRKETDCFNCAALIEANQLIDAKEKDVKALLERIGTLERANAALRGAYRRAVDEVQTIAFLKSKEA